MQGQKMQGEETRKKIRDSYSGVAQEKDAPCCAGAALESNLGEIVGYSEEDFGSAPEDSYLGLGCGNPTAIASLRDGETVLDLGSGAGFDCFLAAGKVGKTGTVIGVDMTPEMIDKARRNAAESGHENVTFRLGEIENIPAADNCVDVVISNCVIDLSPDKKRVYEEALRVLKPGGRLMISDVVMESELPGFAREYMEANFDCIGRAIKKEDYLNLIRSAGFEDVQVTDQKAFPVDILLLDPIGKQMIDEMRESGVTEEALEELVGSIASISVLGRKAL
jgi:ubiquinone/menaquinone biosynthesis C-methylase UbiE